MLIWAEQDGRCFYTGRVLDLSGYHKGNKNALTVDRVIPHLGYVEGNVVLACSIVNRSKQEMNVKEFRDFCAMMVVALDKILMKAKEKE